MELPIPAGVAAQDLTAEEVSFLGVASQYDTPFRRRWNWVSLVVIPIVIGAMVSVMLRPAWASFLVPMLAGLAVSGWIVAWMRSQHVRGVLRLLRRASGQEPY